MLKHYEETITDLEHHLAELDQEIRDTKRTINGLCRRIGEPPRYDDVDGPRSAVTAQRLVGDEYHGKALASVVREILESRKAAKTGPIDVDELFELLVAGGYEFDNADANKAKTGLKISLAKNTQSFYKLPNGRFGLAEWYRQGKASRPARSGAATEPVEAATEESPADATPAEPQEKEAAAKE